VRILGLTVTRDTAPKTPANVTAMPVMSSGADLGGGWWPIIRESFAGAWQQNVTIAPNTVLSYYAVFACVTLIASDIAKLKLRLVVQDKNGIWTETSSAAFSPVLRQPNHYQTIVKFIEQWIVSKLIWGNAYILKERDNRGVVTALYVLHPLRVHPLIAPDGAVYYRLDQDLLSELEDTITVPASEIIQDTMIALYHPLIGVSPIYACGMAAYQGISMQGASTKFFANGSRPGGVLTAPGAIADATAKRLQEYWATHYSGANVGKVAVLGDGLKYESMTMNAVDAQLIDQLKWTADNVCSCYHVPPYMIGVGPPPPYANIEPLLQQYYAQCLQSLLTNLETSLDAGLGLLGPVNGQQYGTEFDIDDLMWMDTRTRAEAAAKSAGTLSPNEARRKFFGAGPTPGGDAPMVQQQYYSLTALAERDKAQPFAKPAPAPPAVPPGTPPPVPAKAVDLTPAAQALEALEFVHVA
jgi:HK97 family phage portal protein